MDDSNSRFLFQCLTFFSNKHYQFLQKLKFCMLSILSKNSTGPKQYQSKSISNMKVVKVFNWLRFKAQYISTSIDFSNGWHNLLLMFSISLFLVATSTVNSCKIWKSVCSQFKVKVALGQSTFNFKTAQGQSISK